MATAAIGGTVGDGATEAEIVAGTGTITITLDGDTWIAAGGGSATLTQSNGYLAASQSSSHAVTLSSVTSGNLIVVLVTLFNTSGDPHTWANTNMSDDVSGTTGWVCDLNNGEVAHLAMGVASFSKVSVGSETTFTFTINATGSYGTCNLCAYEVDGLANNAKDGNGDVASGTSTNATTDAFSTTTYGIVLGTFVVDTSTNPFSISAGSSSLAYSISDGGTAKEENGSLYMVGAAEHFISSGAQSNKVANWTHGTSAPWVALGIGYK
jgi:hypothetical protein